MGSDDMPDGSQRFWATFNWSVQLEREPVDFRNQGGHMLSRAKYNRIANCIPSGQD